MGGVKVFVSEGRLVGRNPFGLSSRAVAGEPKGSQDGFDAHLEHTRNTVEAAGCLRRRRFTSAKRDR